MTTRTPTAERLHAATANLTDANTALDALRTKAGEEVVPGADLAAARADVEAAELALSGAQRADDEAKVAERQAARAEALAAAQREAAEAFAAVDDCVERLTSVLGEALVLAPRLGTTLDRLGDLDGHSYPVGHGMGGFVLRAVLGRVAAEGDESVSEAVWSLSRSGYSIERTSSAWTALRGSMDSA